MTRLVAGICTNFSVDGLIGCLAADLPVADGQHSQKLVLREADQAQWY